MYKYKNILNLIRYEYWVTDVKQILSIKYAQY